jgi:hypothetical protein
MRVFFVGVWHVYVVRDNHAANAILEARDWPPILESAVLVPERVSPSPLTPVNRVPAAEANPLACVSTARKMNPTKIRATIDPNVHFIVTPER